MVIPELQLASLHHLHKQLLSLVPPALVPVRRRQVGHASERGGMVIPKLHLESLIFSLIYFVLAPTVSAHTQFQAICLTRPCDPFLTTPEPMADPLPPAAETPHRGNIVYQAILDNGPSTTIETPTHRLLMS